MSGFIHSWPSFPVSRILFRTIHLLCYCCLLLLLRCVLPLLLCRVFPRRGLWGGRGEEESRTLCVCVFCHCIISFFTLSHASFVALPPFCTLLLCAQACFYTSLSLVTRSTFSCNDSSSISVLPLTPGTRSRGTPSSSRHFPNMSLHFTSHRLMKLRLVSM